jgi:ribonucleoside-diphosphate reductase alpha subunit
MIMNITNNKFDLSTMKVDMNLGNKKIQDVVVGDYVMSFDITENRFRTNRVEQTFLPIVERNRQHKIITDDGASLVTSDIHPMCYLNTATHLFDYKDTQDIIVGDIVKGYNYPQKVEDVLVGNDINEEIDEQFYDINVANDHNYLAGDSDDISKQIVIHNSSTVYFPFWTKEIQDILVLKNNKGASENRVRGIDYGIQFCRLFYQRVIENKNITLFSPNDVKDLYEAFGYNDIFEPLYEKYEKDKSIKKITIKARDLMEQFIIERIQTGRMYVMNIDNANTHSSFLEKIEMSNLCTEITLISKPLSVCWKDGEIVKRYIKLHESRKDEYLKFRKENKELFLNNDDNLHRLTSDISKDLFALFTGPNDIEDGYVYLEETFEKVLGDEPAEIALCVLAAINLGTFKELTELEEICEYIVRGLDYVIEHQEYTIPAAAKMKKRRSIGVGVTNLAYYFAKNNVVHGSQESLELFDKTMEHIQYYLIKASVKLAKEYGPCEYFDRTKYSKGILPIDTYAKTVDEIVNRPYSLDWEALRAEVLEYGMRNSTLTAQMPVESSSLVTNSTNSIEAPRTLISVKNSKQGAIKVTVPEITNLKNKYKLAFDISNSDYNKIYAIQQKWMDQGISANHYYDMEKSSNDLSTSDVTKELLEFYRYGGKQLYYANTLDGKTEDVLKSMMKKEADDKYDKANGDSDIDLDDSMGCEGGACTL